MTIEGRTRGGGEIHFHYMYFQLLSQPCTFCTVISKSSDLNYSFLLVIKLKVEKENIFPSYSPLAFGPALIITPFLTCLFPIKLRQEFSLFYILFYFLKYWIVYYLMRVSWVTSFLKCLFKTIQGICSGMSFLMFLF